MATVTVQKKLVGSSKTMTRGDLWQLLKPNSAQKISNLIHTNSNLADTNNHEGDMKIWREMLYELSKMEQFFTIENQHNWFSDDPEQVAMII